MAVVKRFNHLRIRFENSGVRRANALRLFDKAARARQHNNHTVTAVCECLFHGDRVRRAAVKILSALKFHGRGEHRQCRRGFHHGKIFADDFVFAEIHGLSRFGIGHHGDKFAFVRVERVVIERIQFLRNGIVNKIQAEHGVLLQNGVKPDIALVTDILRIDTVAATALL